MKIKVLIYILLIFPFACHSLYANSDEHLVAYYPFNSNANDESGNNNHGQIHGATSCQGVIKEGFSFDGDDYIDLGNDATLQLTNDFTIMLWVNITNNPNGSFVSKTYGYPEQSRRGFEFYVSSISNSVVAYFWNSSTQIFRGYTRPIDHLKNKWIHIALQHDSSLSEHQMRIYINGEEEELTFDYETISSILEIRNTNESMKIGCFRPVADNPVEAGFFQGLMDEIRIYNCVMSSNEIFKIYYDSKSTISSKTKYIIVQLWFYQVRRTITD